MSRNQLRDTLRGARALLALLGDFAGDTWEQRWLSAGFDAAPRTWAHYPGLVSYDKQAPSQTAMTWLIEARVFRPSYSWMLASAKKFPTDGFLTENGGPDLDAMRSLRAYSEVLPRLQRDAEAGLARVMVRTGKRIAQINGDDLLYYADVVKTSGRQRREHLLWELLVQLGPLAGEAATLRAAWSARGNSRQHSTATLVDRYGIPSSGVRDLLVDYLDEIRPGMDYSSLEGVAYRLARLFWWELTQLNPEQSDLRLDPQLVTAWRERLALTTDGRPRRDVHSVLFTVRGLYRDLAEWSHDDPARWGVWVAPCPVSRTLSREAAKAKRRKRADMHSRTRGEVAVAGDLQHRGQTGP
ncbi:hypothetical protein FOS14_24150 [Skermania sp. ID1734]|uniref:hypothetical protein n=1 Tax=Skermania sp. ID1734 TaxID=2597516 RepID=UPI0011800A71|nr:hypothetical protein [Skermania sp. ID1734]TSD92922.1 hypothetical protein FOS14_24150 [Skermania sp. ID1734]